MFYGRNRGLVDRCGISVSRVTTGVFHLSFALPDPSPFITYRRVYGWSDMTGATGGVGDALPSGTPVFAPVIGGARVVRYLVFCVDHCLSFFSFGRCVVSPSSVCGLWITLLVSSNSSCTSFNSVMSMVPKVFIHFLIESPLSTICL